MNQHPAVMFEIIAVDQEAARKFYSYVFGWSYEGGTGGFAYVRFPVETRPLLGGIGQANSAVPGFEPGHTSTSSSTTSTAQSDAPSRPEARGTCPPRARTVTASP